jgi:hypothetical protein
MDWEDIRYHLHTALIVCGMSLGFGLLGMAIAKVIS